MNNEELAETLSDKELIVNYLKSSIQHDIGVNYFFAVEMEKRGFRDRRTAMLTEKVLEVFNS